MSRAEVTCPNCLYQWEYSGLSKATCYCPCCSRVVKLDSVNADVKDVFGGGDSGQARGIGWDKGRKAKSSGGSGGDSSSHDTYPDTPEDDILDL